MKIVLLGLILLLPFAGKSQTGLSAHTLACENVTRYLQEKIIKDALPVKGNFGKLTEVKNDIKEARFRIDFFRAEQSTKTSFVKNTKTQIQKISKFSFYLDKEMNVVQAFFSEN
ncbi:MAG: hypothetical protein H0U44_02305 [Flavisolibacter sp.]|nr:hypothetical protein [Flavisolibacter sp.]